MKENLIKWHKSRDMNFNPFATGPYVCSVLGVFVCVSALMGFCCFSVNNITKIARN